MSEFLGWKRAFVRKAFSLVELLVVIAIIGILLALALPAVQSVRQRARGVECSNRLRQIGIGLQGHQTLHGSLPKDGENGFGYAAFLLPHVEHLGVYDVLTPHKVKFANATPEQKEAGKTKIDVFLCPNFDGERIVEPSGDARLSFLGNAELLDGMDLANVLDGESTTIVVGESTSDQAWMLPGAVSVSGTPNSGPFSSRHTGGANFLFCDGAVKFLSDNIDAATFAAMGTPNGNEAVSVPE